MAVKRSSQLIVIGASVFVIGAGLVFLGLRANNGGSSTKTAAPAPTQSAQSNGGKVVAQGQTSGVPIVIPSGFTGVEVKLDQVAGLAGRISPGDLINLYATVKSGKPIKDLTPPFTKLVLSKVSVLDVRGVTADGSGDPTLLLALNPADAERVIFFAKFESLWAALVPQSEKPATTAGVDYAHDLVGR
ncbi:MAG: RcpC/CpaB family pilus assembly protein [Actinomycetota bacterium]